MKIFKKFQKKDATKETGTASGEEGAKSSAQDGQTTSGKRKILVVDDDQVIVKALTLKLQAKGYDVASAADGASAVSLIRQENPDLVILDLNFPPEVGMSWDGFKIVEWFKGRTDAGGIPVIIITGEDSPRNKERAEELGALGFFQKPVNIEQLLATIQKALP